MKETLRLNNVRISYPALFTPRAVMPGDKPKFSASLWIAKGSDEDAAVQKAIANLVAEAKEIKFKLSRPVPYYDGEDKVGEVAKDYVILNSSAVRRPAVVDQSAVPVDNEDLIYPGCFVNAYLALYSYKQKTGNGLAFGLNGVQFAKDGPRLDGAPDPRTMFAPIEGAPEAVNSAFM